VSEFELRLAQQLRSEWDARDLELCLTDLSAPLLGVALNAVADVLASFSVRYVAALAANEPQRGPQAGRRRLPADSRRLPRTIPSLDAPMR
jgi:hypothetical protein